MIISRMMAVAAVVLAVGSTTASADFRGEVESARANARAGGPTNERDAELLERWGCLSGTRSNFCERQHNGRHYYRAQRRHRH